MPIDKIEPNPDQPRNQFDEDTLQELADSIKQYGMLQPILVTPKDDFYEIIAGERRWRAAKQAGLNEVPVMIRKYNEKDAALERRFQPIKIEEPSVEDAYRMLLGKRVIISHVVLQLPESIVIFLNTTFISFFPVRQVYSVIIHFCLTVTNIIT